MYSPCPQSSCLAFAELQDVRRPVLLHVQPTSEYSGNTILSDILIVPDNINTADLPTTGGTPALPLTVTIALPLQKG